MSFRPTYLAPLVAIVVAGCGTFGAKTDLIVRVVDARTGQGIAGATVEADYQQARTNGSGQTRFKLAPESFEVTVNHPQFLSTTTTVMLVAGVTASKTIGLYPRPTGVEPLPGPSGDPNGPNPSPQPGGPSGAPSTAPGEKPVAIFGRVTDGAGNRIPNATVFIESGWGIPLGNARTSAVGEYRVEKLPRFQQQRITVIADGYQSVTRTAAPSSDWRMDFTGAWALKKEAPPVVDPGGPPIVRVIGRVEDTMGRPLDGAIVKAESDGVRYPYSEMAIVRGGRFELKCPAEMSIRFTATKVAHRPVTFVERLERPAFGGDVHLAFTGNRALDPAPILEGMR